MATRFYLPSVFLDPLGPGVPAFDGSWESTGSAVRKPMSTARSNSPFVDLAVSSNGTLNNNALIVQFISNPLGAAYTISGTVKGQILAKETIATLDARAQLLIKIVSNDGSTVIGTALAHNTGGVTNEFDVSPFENRKFPKAWAGAGTALSSVSASVGDRIVMEIGYRHGAVTNTATIQIGDNDISDLPENETETISYAPWIELSQDLSFEHVGYQNFANFARTDAVLGGITSFSYKMRALADPGPGYVTWIVIGTPDFAGVQAPSAILAGTAVVSTNWVI